MYGENTKYHGNPYIQGTTVPCDVHAYITRYSSTLYIGIAMIIVFPPYIRKFSSYFHFQVILTFNEH